MQTVFNQACWFMCVAAAGTLGKGGQKSDTVTDLLAGVIWTESKWKDESKGQLMERENKHKVHMEELATLPGAQLCYDCTLKP